jgi:hypothetical protein
MGSPATASSPPAGAAAGGAQAAMAAAPTVKPIAFNMVRRDSLRSFMVLSSCCPAQEL